MAEIHLDHPGAWQWFDGRGPLAVLGPCPHDCDHTEQKVIAWGPDHRHYELVECIGCGRSCRAWTDGGCATTSPWLLVDLSDLPTGAGERPVGSQAGAVVSGDDGPGPNGGGSC